VFLHTCLFMHIYMHAYIQMENIYLMVFICVVYSEENFDEIQDEEVRAWLSSTFTKKESTYAQQSCSQVPRFKTVAQLLVIGNYVHS